MHNKTLGFVSAEFDVPVRLKKEKLEQQQKAQEAQEIIIIIIIEIYFMLRLMQVTKDSLAGRI